MYQLRTALLALAVAAATATAASDASAQTRLRFGHDQPVGSMYDEGHQALKRLVGEKTGNKIEIHIFPAAQLGSEVAMIEGMRIGSVDGAVIHVANASTVVPELALFSVSYLFKDADHFENVGERSEVPGTDRVAGREQEARPQGDRLLFGRRAQRLHPQGPGLDAGGPQGHQDPRDEQPDRGEDLVDDRHHPDADEFRRGLPVAADRRARRGRERPLGDRVEPPLRGGEDHHPDRAPALARRCCSSTSASSTACRRTSRRRCSRQDARPRSSSASATPSSTPRRSSA